MFKKLIESVFGTKPTLKNPALIEKPSKGIHPYDFQNSVTDGFQFCATMNATVPLRILKRHGEIAKQIPSSDNELSPAHGVWIPRVAAPFTVLDEGASMASSMGPIPRDGGDFLPYLLEVRKIIEAPRTNETGDLDEAIGRVEMIRKIPGGRSYHHDEKYRISSGTETIDYFPLVFANEDRALMQILSEIGEVTYAGLSIDHLRALRSVGYTSLKRIVEAPDDVLLSLSGIGKKKLDKIRENVIGAHNHSLQARRP